MVLSKVKKEIKPNEGDFKITYHFAWTPKIIGEERIWLEKYKKVYEYKIRRNIILNPISRAFGKEMRGNYAWWDLICEQRF